MVSIIRRIPSYLEEISAAPRLIHLSDPSRWVGARFVELEFAERGVFDIAFPELCVVWAQRPMQVRFGNSKQRSRFGLGEPQVFCPGHSHYGDWQGSSTNISLDLSPALIERTLHKSLKSDLKKLASSQNVAIKHLLRVLQTEMTSGCPSGPLLGETAIARLLNIVQPDDTRSQNLERRSGQDRIERVRQAIEADIAVHLTLAALANIAGMSTRHFCRVFRHTLGFSPHEYILRRRVDRACDLIRIGHLSLAQISYNVGFASHAHMTATFRRILGNNPSDFAP